jgi:hypothetical protein
LTRFVNEKASSVKDWVLGQTSKMFESGKSGPGTVSTGSGDHGGAPYGTYQMSSKQGTVQQFLKSTPFGHQFEGLIPGSKEFNAKWKSVAKSEPDFEAAQHDFIKKTHFDKQMEHLKGAGIDLSNNGAAVKDSVWSTSVQFGGGTDLIKNALAGKDISKLSDREIVSAIQDYKIANNDRLFKKSSDNVKEGTLNRAVKEKDRLSKLAIAETSIASPTQQPVVSSIPVPKMPIMAKPAPITEATSIATPLNSQNDRRQSISVTVDNGLVGQDIMDRKLAHIVTAGLSGN